ncbi:MAG TPA: phosphoenolpyruvate carboxykinase (ATP), partial [Thermopetrobacter sp.]|nr:phosphoenolpyruvate carboxykinase (ATP) [Thermopetrobacter sp.]
MEKSGRYNPSSTLDEGPFAGAARACYNYYQAQLYELAIRNGEAQVSAHGALVTRTGEHTGRAARDKFTVRDATTEDVVWWDNNPAMSEEHFARLKADFAEHLRGRTVYVQDLYGGADPTHRIRVRVITENAWHALFIRYLLRRPAPAELNRFVPELTVLDFPSFKADPARHGTRSSTVIALNLTEKLVLIGNTAYAGEIKKSVFTTLNFLLPEEGVLPMHCSCNVGPEDDTAIFFGLSGTGKTTLSSDPERTLIGDDEHGWSDIGVFNFEGGCYAKTIRLSPRAEPEIYAATQTWGTILENVVIDPMTRQPNYDDDSITENGRAAYPLRYIPHACDTGVAGQPDNIIFLTADAFGV